MYFSFKKEKYQKKTKRFSSCSSPLLQQKFYSILSKVNTPRTLRTEECYLIIRLFSKKDLDIFSNLSLSNCLLNYAAALCKPSPPRGRCRRMPTDEV